MLPHSTSRSLSPQPPVLWPCLRPHWSPALLAKPPKGCAQGPYTCNHSENYCCSLLNFLYGMSAVVFLSGAIYHRIIRFGMDLWRSFTSIPCQGRVSQARLCRNTSRWVLSVSREGKFMTSLSSLFQFSATLYMNYEEVFSQKKKIFTIFIISLKHPCLNFTNTLKTLCIIIYVSHLHNLKAEIQVGF